MPSFQNVRVPVEHARGRADVAPRGGHARPGDDALLDHVADRHVDAVERTRARDAGVAAAQRELGVLDRVDGRALGRQLQVEIGQLADAPERDVEVTLDQAGHERLAAEVDDALVAVRVLAEVVGAADGGDQVALDPDGGVLDRLTAVAVDQAAVEEQRRRVRDEQAHCDPPSGVAAVVPRRSGSRGIRCPRSRRGRVADLEVALADDVVAVERLAADLGIGGPCGAARRARLEQEAGLQRVELREERHDLGDAPDHLRGRVRLPHLVVDVGAQLRGSAGRGSRPASRSRARAAPRCRSSCPARARTASRPAGAARPAGRAPSRRSRSCSRRRARAPSATGMWRPGLPMTTASSTS